MVFVFMFRRGAVFFFACWQLQEASDATDKMIVIIIFID